MNKNLRIIDLPKEERPKEKLIKYGAESLNNAELLAIILRCGNRGENVLSLSNRILSELNGLDGILNTSYCEITSIKGIKESKASQILAIAEMFRRFNTLKTFNSLVQIKGPKDIAQMIVSEMKLYKQEVLKLIVLDTKNKIIREKNITTLMVTHNLKHAIEYGDRLIMLHKGEVILDISGEEKLNITIEDMLKKFEYSI